MLFDIDGTLIRGGKLWSESFLAALHAQFPDVEMPKISFGGKTDHQIYREMLDRTHITPDDYEGCLHDVIADYLARARAGLPSRRHELKVLPGARELCESLSTHSDVCLGLLTGNVREGAHLKLEAAGLWDFFKMGAYGDDSWDRYKLPAVAVARARQEFGLSFEGKQVVIIGDTIHDVRCGRSIGVRTIAVGTGYGVDQEELRADNPDFYFEDLGDVARATDAILREL